MLAPQGGSANLAGMSTAAQVADADARQNEIYRRMTPSARLALAMQMNDSMRALMDSGLRSTHPHWTSDERRREIARRIRHARG